MGFRDLDNILKIQLPKLADDAFRYSYLCCLREIAGNLDTLAIVGRAHIEQEEKIRVTLEHLMELYKVSEENAERYRQFMSQSVHEAVEKAERERVAKNAKPKHPSVSKT